jgi:hypothetical protein
VKSGALICCAYVMLHVVIITGAAGRILGADSSARTLGFARRGATRRRRENTGHRFLPKARRPLGQSRVSTCILVESGALHFCAYITLHLVLQSLGLGREQGGGTGNENEVQHDAGTKTKGNPTSPSGRPCFAKKRCLAFSCLRHVAPRSHYRRRRPHFRADPSASTLGFAKRGAT